MSDDVLIKVEGVSKKFCRSLKRSLLYGVQDVGNEMLGKKGHHDELRKNEFWAVDDVSFELKRGECLGLIGHNGAGKTTLLRMLNGLIKPDQGRIEIRGKVGALIALGTGFNPILTGRENIYVNASVLGMNKQVVSEKIDAIIDFAEIREFIDSPVQSYSSGMSVRLGFAIAAILIEPDVLFLDEVLAVGDIGFVIKCLNIVRGMTNDAAVVFVSHNMQQISNFCTRVMVMNHGNLLIDSRNPFEGIDNYYALIKHTIQVSGTGAAEIINLTLRTSEKSVEIEESPLNVNDDIVLLLNLCIDASVEKAKLVVVIRNEAEVPIRTFPIIDDSGNDLQLTGGRHTIEVRLGPIELNSGKYSFAVTISDALSNIILGRVQGIHPFRVASPFNYWSNGVSPRNSRIISVNDPSSIEGK